MSLPNTIRAKSVEMMSDWNRTLERDEIVKEWLQPRHKFFRGPNEAAAHIALAEFQPMTQNRRDFGAYALKKKKKNSKGEKLAPDLSAKKMTFYLKKTNFGLARSYHRSLVQKSSRVIEQG